MIEIPLTGGHVALIDDVDARLAEFKWTAQVRWDRGTVYAQRRARGPDGKWTTLLLHREVLNAPPGFEVDHKNGDGLRCVRENLRLATGAQNSQNRKIRSDNRSGFKGVGRDRGGRSRWYAHIRVSGKRIRLGTFDSPEEAARAYDAAARQHFGEFARPNFPLANAA